MKDAAKPSKKELSSKQREDLLKALQARFQKNMNRHQGLEWAKVQDKLEGHPETLWSLSEMERTGGEPDVVGYDKKTGRTILCDDYGRRVGDREPQENDSFRISRVRMPGYMLLDKSEWQCPH